MYDLEIFRLATAVREAVRRRRDTNSIATQRRVRVRRRDFNLKYRDDFGFANFQPERSEMDLWDWRDQERFQDSVVNELEEFKSVTAALESKANALEDFVRAISYASFHGLDDQELRERASAFASQLEGHPLPVKVTAFIDGISIQESPLSISNSITLRWPEPEDVAEYIDGDEYGCLPVTILQHFPYVARWKSPSHHQTPNKSLWEVRDSPDRRVAISGKYPTAHLARRLETYSWRIPEITRQ
jgi:hypothetical protein